MMKKLEIFH